MAPEGEIFVTLLSEFVTHILEPVARGTLTGTPLEADVPLMVIVELESAVVAVILILETALVVVAR